MARRLCEFLDAYGLTDRDGFVEEICDRIARAVREMVAAAERTGASVSDFVEVLTADIEVIQSNRTALELAITTDFAAQSAA